MVPWLAPSWRFSLMRGGNRAKRPWGHLLGSQGQHSLPSLSTCHGLKHPDQLDREWGSKDMRLKVRTNTFVFFSSPPPPFDFPTKSRYYPDLCAFSARHTRCISLPSERGKTGYRPRA